MIPKSQIMFVCSCHFIQFLFIIIIIIIFIKSLLSDLIKKLIINYRFKNETK